MEIRKRCYQEKVLRGLYAMHPGYDKGWTDQDKQQYGWNKNTGKYEGILEEEYPSLCDILHYNKPEQPSCDKVGRYPVGRAKPNEPLFLALARLEVVARQPERQQEIFGWVTPAKHDFVGQTAFEIAKARYWGVPDPSVIAVTTSVGESLEHLYGLKDTADFHANYLLRLLYLYGNTPPHLRTHRAAWRRIDHFNRDINFSAQLETTIRNHFLAFKFWIDEPFFADDDGGKKLRQWRATLATQQKRLGGDKTSPDEDPNDEKYKFEMTFWSENHQVLFATAEYLAGQLWPDAIFRVGNHFRLEGPEKTRPSDMIGQQHMAKAKVRLLCWLNDRLRFGFSEWNAPGYYAEDFTALFNLADFCLDEEIRTRACMVLDLLIFDLARFTHRGNFGVSAGRCYFEQKRCGYDQPVGDLVEILFGTRGGTIVEPTSVVAGTFASSKRYKVPDVLMAIGQDQPETFVDRSRVSINFEEAANYNVGFESDEDVMFWWSRAAFFTKQVIENTRKVAEKYHLMITSPFKDVLSETQAAATAIHITGYAALAAAGLFAPPLLPFVGNPFSKKEAKAADIASIITEGSALTKANLYTYLSRHAMLSSVQNFRSGQFNLQTQFCQATLSLGATVWTTQPSAGSYISRTEKDIINAGAGVGGALTAGIVGEVVLGPFGLVGGTIYGGLKGANLLKGEDSGSHKGEINLIPAQHDGPNWWTGSVTAPRVIQFKNAAIVAYKPKDFQLLLFGHRTHAWFPKAAFDPGSVVQRNANCNEGAGLWTFGKVGDGYVGLFSAQTPVWTTTGPWMDKELVAEGAHNFFIFQVGSSVDFGSYDKFVDRVSRARIHVGGLHLVTAGEVAGATAGAAEGAVAGAEIGSAAGPVGTVVGAVGGGIEGAIFGAKQTSEDFECSYDIPNGDRLELHYDDNQVRYAGEPLCDDNFPRFENPYIKCGRVEWDRYLYTIKHKDNSLTHDFREITNNMKNPRVRRSIDTVEGECDSGPRPFYIIGHNPNTIADVNAALDAGANAIEPDVNVYEDRQNELCVSETGLILDTDEGGDSDAPSLIKYLIDLHAVALKRPELALVYFDCKPKVATAEHGVTLLNAIRTYLTYDTEVNVIISVSSLSETAIFDKIKNDLRPREGVMIDEENDPDAVSKFFTDGKVDNQCYANGNAFQSPTLSPHLRPSMDKACALRAGRGKIKIIFTWTLADADMMREYIRIGVDGIIPGILPSAFDAIEIPKLLAITREHQFQSLIRLANRNDNPFIQPNAAYAMTIHTGDVHNAGTDANLTFTLKGKLGSATKTVDASLIGSILGKTPGRMEADAWDYVTLPSPDLGDLLAITVQRDDEGNAPGWFLDKIIVESFRYGVSKRAEFNRWIDTTPFTQPLV